MKLARWVFLKLHLWIGLAGAILAILVAGSGAILVFENEIERVTNPRLNYIDWPAQAKALPMGHLGNNLTKAYPKARPIAYFYPEKKGLSTTILASNGTRVYMNQFTGEVLGARQIAETLSFKIHQFHTRLLIPNAKVIKNGPGKPPTLIRNHVGSTIVGWTTVALFFLALSGLWIWFPRMVWKFNIRNRWRRLNFDLHNVSGLYSLPLLIVLAGTGIFLSFNFPSQWIHMIANTPESEDAPEVEFRKGVPFLEPDQMKDAAEKALPGAVVTLVNVPRPPEFYTVVTMRFPEDRTPVGRSRVYVDPYTAKVLLVEGTRQAPIGTKILHYVRPLHTGDVFGWWLRIPLLIASLLVVVQAVTGALIWIARTFKKRGRPASEDVPAEEIEPVPEPVATPVRSSR